MQGQGNAEAEMRGQDRRDVHPILLSPAGSPPFGFCRVGKSDALGAQVFSHSPALARVWYPLPGFSARCSHPRRSSLLRRHPEQSRFLQAARGILRAAKPARRRAARDPSAPPVNTRAFGRTPRMTGQSLKHSPLSHPPPLSQQLIQHHPARRRHVQ